MYYVINPLAVLLHFREETVFRFYPEVATPLVLLPLYVLFILFF